MGIISMLFRSLLQSSILHKLGWVVIENRAGVLMWMGVGSKQFNCGFDEACIVKCMLLCIMTKLPTFKVP